MSINFGIFSDSMRTSNRLIADYQISISVYWLHQREFFNTLKSESYTWEYTFGGKTNVTISSQLNHDFGNEENDFIDGIELWYPHRNSEGHLVFNQNIQLSSSVCNLGGKRYWFICECGKRVGLLFLSGDYFACRHCYNLTYQSRNDNRGSRVYLLYRKLLAYKKADEIRTKTKRYFYSGIPTRNYKRILNLENKQATRMLRKLNEVGLHRVYST